jgi:hypothetical protein
MFESDIDEDDYMEQEEIERSETFARETDPPSEGNPNH